MQTALSLYMGGKRASPEAIFARRLRELRMDCGYQTVRELAKALDMLENTYSRYERAECKPDLFLIPKLCSVLGIDYNEFFARTLPTRNKNHKG